jgi:hypothetical protein
MDFTTPLDDSGGNIYRHFPPILAKQLAHMFHTLARGIFLPLRKDLLYQHQSKA